MAKQTVTLGMRQNLKKIGYKSYEELFLDWQINFLTIGAFVDYHQVNYPELTENIALKMVDNGREIYNINAALKKKLSEN